MENSKKEAFQSSLDLTRDLPFHRNKFLNYRLNRWYSLGYARLEDIERKAAMTNAKSVSTRIFRKEEHADQHCQIGNLNVALEAMLAWTSISSFVHSGQ